ncbi:hypothetical protein FJZ26_01380 [Candidatus Parvarchaeota archaeon]|nr:hypothetical protein [Candidatus Parvarchaeota archaeon]
METENASEGQSSANALAEKRIAIIGAGNMGNSLALGLHQSKKIDASRIVACGDNASKALQLSGTGIRVAGSAYGALEAAGADIVVLAIKPNREALEGLFSSLGGACSGKLVISVMNGVSVAYLESRLTGAKVVRCMPDINAREGKSFTGFAASGKVTEKDMETLRCFFGCLGEFEQIGERQFAAWTGASCLPGILAHAVFSSCQSVFEQEGFSKGLSRGLVLKKSLSTLNSLGISGEEFADYGKRVASKGGGTEAANLLADKIELAWGMGEVLKAAIERCRQIEREVSGAFSSV